jgi:hypothetical protein
MRILNNTGRIKSAEFNRLCQGPIFYIFSDIFSCHTSSDQKELEISDAKEVQRKAAEALLCTTGTSLTRAEKKDRKRLDKEHLVARRDLVTKHEANECERIEMQKAWNTMMELIHLSLNLTCDVATEADYDVPLRLRKSSMATAKQTIVEGLCLFEKHFPHSELCMMIHELIHIPEAVFRWNHPRNYWAFFSERYVPLCMVYIIPSARIRICRIVNTQLSMFRAQLLVF